MPFRIRQARIDDVAVITGIYGAEVRNGTASYELEPPDETEMTARFQALHDAGMPYLAAEEDGRFLGYAYASAFRPRRAYRFTVEDSIYLAPGARGRGVGKVLLAALVAECERLGFRQMVAVIGDGERNTASIRLHDKLGFSPAGRLEASGYKQGRWLDTVFMQRALGDGRASQPDPGSLPERRFRTGA